MRIVGLFYLILVLSSFTHAGEIPLDQGQSIIYDRAVRVREDSMVFENPLLRNAVGDTALIKGKGYYDIWYAKYYGRAFCKAIGMKSGVVTDLQFSGDSSLAEFNDAGKLIGVNKDPKSFGILYVVCHGLPAPK